MIYEGGWLEELAVRGILTPSSQRWQGVSVWLTAVSLAECPVHQCPLEQMLAVPLLSTSSRIVAVSVMVLTTGPRAGESKP